MIFYLTDYVLHSKAPVVEGCVEVNLLLCQNFVVGQDVLYEDVHVRLESADAESPLPRQQSGGIHVASNVVCAGTELEPRVVKNCPHECDARHKFEEAMAVL